MLRMLFLILSRKAYGVKNWSQKPSFYSSSKSDSSSGSCKMVCWPPAWAAESEFCTAGCCPVPAAEPLAFCVCGGWEAWTLALDEAEEPEPVSDTRIAG